MPVGVALQLLPALVGLVERVEEGDRVGDMDRHGDAQLPGRGPERIETTVVDRHEPAVRAACPQAERLPDLEAAGARRNAVPQPRRLGLTERRVVSPALVVETREHRDASGQRPLPAVDLAPQPVTPAAVQVDDRLDPGQVERLGELGSGARGPVAAECRPEVIVRIDRGKPRTRHVARDRPQPRPRPVARQRHLARRLAHPFSPLRAIPRTNNCCARTNSTIIGARLTRAPAIISGHLPTNWPWKNDRPSVVVN